MGHFCRLAAGSDGTEILARTIGRRSADRPGWKNIADGFSLGKLEVRIGFMLPDGVHLGKNGK
jgi:hypothetical protein